MTLENMLDELTPFKFHVPLGPDPYGVILTSYQANTIKKKLQEMEAKVKAASALANRIVCRPYETNSQELYDMAKKFCAAGEGK